MGKLKIGAFASCAALCVAVFGGSFGAKANDSIADKQQQVNAIREANEKRKQEIAALGEDISDNEYAMELIGAQIDGYLAEIAAYGELVTDMQAAVAKKKAEIEQVEKDIADKEAEIEVKKAQIEELQAQNTANLEQFGKLARYMYMNNMSSQLPILNGSDDWYDYYVYSDVVNNITEQNADFMNEILASIKRQEDMITEFNEEIAVLDADKARLEKERKTSNRMKLTLKAQRPISKETPTKNAESYTLSRRKTMILWQRSPGLKAISRAQTSLWKS